MKTAFLLRLLLILFIALAIASVLTAFLYASDLAFSVWHRLREAPLWLQAGYGMLAALAGFFTVWLMFRLFKPASIRPAARHIGDEKELQAYIDELQDQGIDTQHALRELEDLRRRREGGHIHVALCGEISTGKSSLVKALIPEAEISVSPVGGSTRGIQRYTWVSPAGDELIIDDLPGLNEADGGLDRLTLEESTRSHLVLYVVDGDLTRDQRRALDTLSELGKPMILVLNKSDRYDTATRLKLVERLRQSAPTIKDLRIAVISAGGMEEITRIDNAGREEIVARERQPVMDDLRDQLQQVLDNDPTVLEKLRDAAFFNLVQSKLDQQVLEARRKKASEIITQSSRKAVIGGMAAITPGSDVVIQGVIGYRMVQALSENYQIPAKSIDIDHFLKLAGKQVMRSFPLALAVTGNLLKVFPGIGTLGGGLLHAVAYGLIVESLGKAVSDTLAARGKLPPQPALSLYEEKLAENLESRATKLIKYALAHRSDGK